MPYKLIDQTQTESKLAIKEPPSDKNIDVSPGVKKRLIFLVHERSDSIGGVQRHSARLRSGLKANYDIERLNWKNPRNGMPLNFPGLFRKAKSNKNRLVYCDDAVSSIVGTNICGRSGNRVMATVHGLDIIVPLPGYQPLIISALKKLDKIVCVSRATAAQVSARGIEESTIEVIPNAAEKVDQARAKDDSLLSEIKTLAGIDLTDKKVLFSLGRPLKRKGFDRFIREVMPYLPEDYVYIAAGPKPSKPGWLKAINYLPVNGLSRKVELALGIYSVHEELIRLSNHPRVYYLNGVSEYLRDLLFAATDLFIMPNRTVEGDMEGFGIVALEAAVRGKPVIATGIEGITDAVIDGENGYCFAEGDDTGMAKAIIALLNDPEKMTELGNRAREFTLRKFALDNIVNRYEKLIEGLLVNGHKSNL